MDLLSVDKDVHLSRDGGVDPDGRLLFLNRDFLVVNGDNPIPIPDFAAVDFLFEPVTICTNGVGAATRKSTARDKKGSGELCQ